MKPFKVIARAHEDALEAKQFTGVEIRMWKQGGICDIKAGLSHDMIPSSALFQKLRLEVRAKEN
jgi:hypothetical protein